MTHSLTTGEVDPSDTTEEDALVAFFRALPAAARAEYAALAELDRRFGEDVEAERSAGASSRSEPK